MYHNNTSGGGNHDLIAFVGTINANNTVTWGAKQTIATHASSGFSNYGVEKTSDSSKVICWYTTSSDDYGYTRLLTISNTGSNATISAGSAVRIRSGSDTVFAKRICHLSGRNAHVMCYTHASKGYLTVNYDDDATPSWTNEITLVYVDIPHWDIVDIGNNQVLITAHRSDGVWVITATIPESGGGDATLGNWYEPYNQNPDATNCVAWDTEHDQGIVVFRNNANGYIECRAMSVSGSSGSNITLHGSNTSILTVDSRYFSSESLHYDPNSNKYILFYEDNNDGQHGKAITWQMDKDSSTPKNVLSTPLEINVDSSGNNQELISKAVLAYNETAKKYVFIWANGEHDGTGKPWYYNVYQPAGTNLSTTNFLGYADAAYSDGANATIEITGSVNDTQSSLTPGTQYYFTNSGALTTSSTEKPSVKAGMALAATKVKIP